MPNWKKVITSGSSAQLNHITASGNISGSSTSTGSFGHLMVDGGTFSYSYVYFSGLPTSGGVVSAVQYEANTSPTNHIVTEFTSDNDNITVGLEIHSNGNPWQPGNVVLSGGGASSVTVQKQTWSRQGSGRTWTTTANLTDANTTGTLTATLSDGDTTTCAYTRAADAPDVSNATWGQLAGTFSAGVYPTSSPGVQTAVKEDDTVDIELTLNSLAHTITVTSAGASSTIQNFNGTFSTGTVIIENVNVGSGTGNKTFTVKAQRSDSDYGSSDATATILLDQVAHSYSSLHDKVFSPVANFALADGDSMTGDVYISTWNGSDTISYTSTAVTITSPYYYAETKTYTYLDGTYSTSNNVTISSTRRANGKSNSTTYAIYIADDAPSVTSISGDTSRLRSRTGSNKTYTITLNANQLLQAADLERDASDDGTTLPELSGDATGDTTWTATMTITEAQTKNTGANKHTWTRNASFYAKNGAGKTDTSITDITDDYTVGGFEERRVNVAQFTAYGAIGTMVTNKDNANKLVGNFVTGEGVYVHNWNNVTFYPGTKKFTIVNADGSYDADGTYVRCLDTNIINAGAWFIDIEEEA